MFENAREYFGQIGRDLRSVYWNGSTGAKAVDFTKESFEKTYQKSLNDDLRKYLAKNEYDEATGLFENQKTVGFVLRVTACNGFGKRSRDAITQLISRDVGKECIVQVVNFASPYIKHLLDDWFEKGEQDGKLGRLALKQAEFLEKTAKEMKVDATSNFRDFEIYYSFSVPLAQKMSLQGIRNKIRRSLANTAIDVMDVDLDEFGLLFSKMFAPEIGLSEGTNLADVLDGDYAFEQHCDFALSTNGTETFKYLIFEVVEYPYRRDMEDSIDYVGDFETGRGLGFPFWLSLAFRLTPPKESARKMKRRSFVKVNQADSKVFAKDPKAKEETEECLYVTNAVASGDKLSKLCMHIVIRVNENIDIEEAAQAVKDHFYGQGFEINRVYHDVFNNMLKTLPLGIGENWRGLSATGVTGTKLNSSCINLLPCFADNQNYDDILMPLIGKRGQLSFWDCFDPLRIRGSSFGASVAGKMGSGKSVWLQEYTKHTLRLNGQIVIIDDGRSSAESCLLFGGELVDFKNSNYCVNPFSFFRTEERLKRVDDYSSDFVEPFFDMLMTVLCAICNIDKEDKKDFQVGLHRECLNRAARIVLKKKGSSGGLCDVRDVLLNHPELRVSHMHQISEDMAFALKEYAVGDYAKRFNGEANLRLENALTAFEMGSVGNETLKTCVLSTVGFFVYTQMIDKARRFSLAVDEAKGVLTHPVLKGLWEKLARKSRKYQANIVAATQLVTDFSKENLTPHVIWANSTWKILFDIDGGDAEVLVREASKKMPEEQQDYMIKMARTMRNHEFMIINSDRGYWDIQRIALDPFTSRLYSSVGEEREALERLKENGYSTAQAIEVLNQQSREYV